MSPAMEAAHIAAKRGMNPMLAHAKAEKHHGAVPDWKPAARTSKTGRRQAPGDPAKAPSKLVSWWVTAHIQRCNGENRKYIARKLGHTPKSVDRALLQVRHYIAKHGEGSERAFLSKGCRRKRNQEGMGNG